MGAWGVGPLDNDTAGDLALFWDRYITRGRKQDPRFWTPGAITELFRFSYFRGFSGLSVEDRFHQRTALVQLLFQRIQVVSHHQFQETSSGSAQFGPFQHGVPLRQLT